MRSDVRSGGRARRPVPPSRRGRAPGARLAAALLGAVLLALVGSAAAHATLVFGTVTTEPAPPRPGEPVEIRLELADPTDTPVEDALVHVEADPQAPSAAADAGTPGGAAADADADGDPLVVSDRFEEVEPGVYRTEIVLPDDGLWTLTFRDRTFRQEEARASITMAVGEDAEGTPLSFIFPPTATGPTSLTTWLVWLVGLPIVAGAVVTAMVLRGGSSPGDGDDASDAGDAGRA